MRQGGVRMLGLTLVVALGAVACSSGGGAVHPTAAAARDLRRAARRTLAAPSYKIRMGEVDVKHPHVVTERYQAPDRTATGSRGNEMITIRNTTYMTAPDGSQMFTRNTIPLKFATAGGYATFAASAIASLLSPARHSRRNVSVRGDTYVATTSKKGASGPVRFTYRVSDGRITDVRIDQRVHGKSFNRAYHYFDFGVPNAIEPPPASQVKDAVPTPECLPGGLPPSDPGTGIQACVTTRG